MTKIYQRTTARRDLIEHFMYLAENAGLEIADKFLENTEASFNDLANQPMMGMPLITHHPDLVGIRKWHVKDFDNYLIFYLPSSNSISIVRLLHATRDWWGLLGLKY
jgi:toxin ParE1/3/4